MHTGAREKVIQKRILLRADEGGCMVVALGARLRLADESKDLVPGSSAPWSKTPDLTTKVGS
jgi:hypothetical protein